MSSISLISFTGKSIDYPSFRLSVQQLSLSLSKTKNQNGLLGFLLSPAEYAKHLFKQQYPNQLYDSTKPLTGKFVLYGHPGVRPSIRIIFIILFII